MEDTGVGEFIMFANNPTLFQVIGRGRIASVRGLHHRKDANFARIPMNNWVIVVDEKIEFFFARQDVAVATAN